MQITRNMGKDLQIRFRLLILVNGTAFTSIKYVRQTQCWEGYMLLSMAFGPVPAYPHHP